MNAITLLKNDHRTVESLFSQLEGSPGEEEKLDLVREVIRELSIHASIEEQLFYPTVRRLVAGGEDMVEEGIDEHQSVKDLLSDLDDMVPTETGYDDKVRKLIAEVRHHVDEEEGEILPKLQSAMSAKDLDELGQRMERAKSTAPTRPHPMAPSRPPANLVAGAVAGVVDRARDRAREALTERRRQREGTAPAKRSTAKKSSVTKSTSRKTSSTRPTTKRTTAKKSTPRKSTARWPVIHVTPDKSGGWRAATRGAARAVARGDNKSEVVRRARESAKSKSGRLVIHDAKGKIQEERTYGADPRRSKG